MFKFKSSMTLSASLLILSTNHLFASGLEENIVFKSMRQINPVVTVHDLDQIKKELKSGINGNNVEAWFEQANSLRHRFDHQDAVALANTIYNDILDAKLKSPLNAICWRNKGKIKLRQGKVEEGIKYLKTSLNLDTNNASTLVYIGATYSNEKKNQTEAILYYKKALHVKNISNKIAAKAYLGLGNARDGHDREHYQAAEKLARQLNDNSLLCQALIGRGNARDGHDREHYQEAENLARQLNDNSLLCQALIGRGNARDGEQREHYQAAEKLARQLNDNSLLCQALIGRGNARDGDNKVHYQAAEKLARQLNDNSLLCQALIGRGNVRDGDNKVHYQAAEKLARQLNDNSLLCQALIGRGNVRDGEQREHYQAAEKLARQLNDNRLLCQALIGRGNARDGHDREHYQEAENLARQLNDNSLLCQALMGLGNVYCRERDNKTGKELYEKAMNIAPVNSELYKKAKEACNRAAKFIEQGNGRQGRELDLSYRERDKDSSRNFRKHDDYYTPHSRERGKKYHEDSYSYEERLFDRGHKSSGSTQLRDRSHYDDSERNTKKRKVE